MSTEKDDEHILSRLLKALGDTPSDLDADSTPALDADIALVGTTLINRYKIQSIIGVGGWSTVYKAFDKNLERLTAIKLMHQHLCLDQSKLMRFQREAESSSHLNHPNLAVLYDYGELLKGRPFISMEFIDGISLQTLLKKKQFLTTKETIAICNQTCDAMTAIHAAKLVHRDLKPSNIIIGASGRVKILDFGIAKWLLREQETLTKTEETLGTPAYMSPEQCMDENLDARSDIYSLGCIAYEALTGLRPFAAESALKCMQLHTQTVPPRFNAVSHHREIPSSVEKAVFKALAKDPQERFDSAQTFKIALAKSDFKQGIAGTFNSFFFWQAYKMRSRQIAWSKAQTHSTRILSFPNRVVGNVYLLSRNSRGELERTLKYESVSGALTVPAGSLLELTDVPSDNLPALDLLSKLRPNDIACLTLTNKELSDVALQAINHLITLETLNIDNCYLDDNMLKELHLPILKNLDIKSNEITDQSMCVFGQSFPTLKSLNLRDTKVTDYGVTQLLKNTKLTALDISETKITNQALMELSKHPQFLYLKMTATKISSDGVKYLSALPALQNLGLCENDICDEAIQALIQLHTLTFLNVNHTNVSPEGLQALKKAKPGCEILR